MIQPEAKRLVFDCGYCGNLFQIAVEENEEVRRHCFCGAINTWSIKGFSVAGSSVSPGFRAVREVIPALISSLNDNQPYTCPKCFTPAFTPGFNQQVSTVCKSCNTTLVLKFKDYKFESVEIHPPGPPNPPRSKWQEVG